MMGNQSLPFRVEVLFLVQEKGLRERVLADLATYERGAPIDGHSEQFAFTVRSVGSEGELQNELKLIQMRNAAATVVIVSDRLTNRVLLGKVVSDPRGRMAPAKLVTEIRRQFLISPVLIGLVGLHEGPALHVRDIDRTVSVDNVTAQSLREAILNVSLGLRMKAPPPARDVSLTRSFETVRIEVVQTEVELQKSFGLRHNVYGRIMRYLPDEVINHPAQVDIDNFDTNSIHFAAVREKTQEVVGTTRLVLNYPAMRTVTWSGSAIRPPFALLVHRDWTLAIAQRAGAVNQRRVNWLPPQFGVFPILLSTDFRNNQKQVIDETLHGCELSRVLVAPAYRGYGISRMLVKAAIAKAFQLDRKTALLECIPKHVEMYAKYGFRRLDGAPHSRYSDLDQYAIGMRLPLTEGPVASSARRLVKEITGGATGAPFAFVHYGPFDVRTDIQLSPEEESSLNLLDSSSF
jgi:predicted GNAT family N-acyltransferase